jgi:uncharacterized oxidoreductase
MIATNGAGLDLGFARQTPEAVGEVLVAGLENGAREAIRSGDVRVAAINTNRERPGEVDERSAA